MDLPGPHLASHVIIGQCQIIADPTLADAIFDHSFTRYAHGGAIGTAMRLPISESRWQAARSSQRLAIHRNFFNVKTC